MSAPPPFPLRADAGTLACQAAFVILEGWIPMIPYGCRNRWLYQTDLCFADAARSGAPDGVGFCGAHAGQYDRRLKSLSCPTLRCPHLVMTATTSDGPRAESAWLGRIPEALLKRSCVLYHLGGWDEACVPSSNDRHGVFTAGSSTVHDGHPSSTAVPLPASIAKILSESVAPHMEIPLGSGTYVAKTLHV